VYLTDQKRTDPPARREPVSFEREVAPAPERTAPTADPAAEQFEKMGDSLRAGVQVVAAPQLFPTPPDLAARMVELAEIEAESRVLEPSCGMGGIMDHILVSVPTVAVEINPALAERLKAKYPGCRVVCGDFLECNGDLGQFDRIIMNPPFENGSDIRHIRHALTFLRPGGRLVAICAAGPRQTEQLRPLAVSWELLPAGTFAGTGVHAALLVIVG